MKDKSITVKKESGISEPFSIEKLRNSLSKAKAEPDDIDTIIENLQPILFSGITTRKIYSEAFKQLNKLSQNNAARYHLKRGIMELGPSGFPFERYIAELFKYQKYATSIGTIVKGRCVNHEIDVIARKDHELVYIECKYRNQAGIAIDVKTPLYIHSRFQDILENGLIQANKDRFIGMLVTNAKFTSDATQYALCRGIDLLSWNFPYDNSLKDLIDSARLYPLTCLSSLTIAEKHWLLEKGIVLAKEVYNNENLLIQAGLNDFRRKKLMSEAKTLCQKEDEG